MDIGRLKNNDTFYKGFEDEPEVTLTIVGDTDFNIHIWNGYFEFIFGSPALDGKGWDGFTRDLNQIERCFSNDDYIIEDVKEYLDDMLIYAGNQFEYEDTAQCYDLLKDFLEYALKNNHRILVHYF